MEAIAKHDFKGSSDEELGFDKGDIMKVVGLTEYTGWYKGEKDGREGSIPANYIQLKPCPYVTNRRFRRAETEAFLLQTQGSDFVQPDGAFLIGESESTPGDFSLSVKHDNQVEHFKVLRDGAGKYFLWVVKFNSINQMVEYHRTSSVSRSQTIHLRDLLSPIPEGTGFFDTEPMVLAKYDFKPSNSTELELRKGDIIKVVAKNDANWWTGEIKRNNELCRGDFPVNYVVPHTE